MVAVTATWGLCFVLISWGLRDAPVLWFAALRSGVAGVALLAYGSWKRRPTPRSRGDWGLVGALAATNAGLAFAAMFAGVAGLTTGAAAVLANAQPLLILLPAWWLYREPVSPRTVVALAAGFVGLVVVAGPGGGGTGAALSLLAAAAITTGTLLVRLTGHLDVVMVSGWHFLLGGMGLSVAAAAVEGSPQITWTPRFVAVLGLLSLAGTAWTFLVWFREAQRYRLSLLSAWTFLTPVFGIGFGVLLLGERPSGWTLAGLAMVLIALWFVLRPGTDPINPGTGPDRGQGASAMSGS
ncbi:DMT family transporter [Blastococcus sp. TF02-8]|uniref:DMT family transporter n=1 Tax=Blastococcus sp. TF02-8 TaxID=2250574 RepID=UPI001F0C5F94|nr:DMT family transporter [Blastococcus sp. TF02-8]